MLLRAGRTNDPRKSRSGGTMLTQEENDRLSRVGPGTEMGELMRRYWHPIAPTAVLDENPVRKVKILDEELVLYRDRSGTLGLVGPRCAHRLVHLEFGIPEDHGLRCPYHGWCYDQTGQCTETPLESPNSRLKDSVSIGGYPVQEMGGLVWAYLGPDPVPILPPWDFLVWPNAVRQIGVTVIPCNWLQCHENSADPFHGVYTHGHFFKYVLERSGQYEERVANEQIHRVFTSMNRPGGDHVVFERDQYGFKKGVQYLEAKGAKGDSIGWSPYNIFPYSSRGTTRLRTQVNMRVPMDDTHTYHLSYLLYHAPDIDAPAQETVPYFDVPMFDEAGEPVLDFVLGQDLACWYGQGVITDRSEEHLCSTDLAIIEFRKLLSEQIEVVKSGADPMNVFRDPAEIGDCIAINGGVGVTPKHGVGNATRDRPSYRDNYDAGYFRDDIDRYGPATSLATDLMRKANANR
jgi:5,5'-dehydrodivanillate O-demethylase oxygenase subunit